MVHAIIKIGIWTFDWDDIELIHAHKLTNSDRRNEIFAIDVGLINVYDFLTLKLDKMLALITHWNKTKQYKPFECNCQTFTEELIQELGLKESFNSKITGNLENYFKLLKTDGPQEIWFPTPKYKYHTHKKLDICINDYFKNNPLKINDVNDPDYLLLKSFDRVFWHKYLEEGCKDVERYEPGNCKFGPPISAQNTDGSFLALIE